MEPSRGRAMMLGSKQKPNDSVFRTMFKDRNDAVIIDADVERKTSQFAFGMDSRIISLTNRLERSQFIYHLQPLRSVVGMSSMSRLDFLAARETWMKRIIALRQTLVGLFQTPRPQMSRGVINERDICGLRPLPTPRRARGNRISLF
jgi:hypothetical protein